MSEILSQIHLTPAETAGLPAPIRRKIEAAFGPIDKANGDWRLVGSRSEPVAALVDKALMRLPAIATVHAEMIRKRNIDKLLEIIAADMPHADVDANLELENAEMRAEYLGETRLLTAVQVREQSGLEPRNKSEPASRWKREGKIFAVRKGGVDFYPAFQFEDGAPKPVIKKVLAELPDDLSSWQTAFWFDSGNGWLDGAEPQDCLDQPDNVIEAARMFARPAIG